nr:MAG TPA: hypothetical protein [Caudoviricetes sp.]
MLSLGIFIKNVNKKESFETCYRKIVSQRKFWSAFITNGQRGK